MKSLHDARAEGFERWRKKRFADVNAVGALRSQNMAELRGNADAGLLVQRAGHDACKRCVWQNAHSPGCPLMPRRTGGRRSHCRCLPPPIMAIMGYHGILWDTRGILGKPRIFTDGEALWSLPQFASSSPLLAFLRNKTGTRELCPAMVNNLLRPNAHAGSGCTVAMAFDFGDSVRTPMASAARNTSAEASKAAPGMITGAVGLMK